MTPQDLAELNAAAKRLNVQSKVQSLMAGVNTKQIDSTAEQLKEVEEELVPVTEPPSQETVEAVEVEDECPCLSSNECPDDKMEFTFGKSCEFGQVRYFLHFNF